MFEDSCAEEESRIVEWKRGTNQNMKSVELQGLLKSEEDFFDGIKSAESVQMDDQILQVLQVFGNCSEPNKPIIVLNVETNRDDMPYYTRVKIEFSEWKGGTKLQVKRFVVYTSLWSGNYELCLTEDYVEELVMGMDAQFYAQNQLSHIFQWLNDKIVVHTSFECEFRNKMLMDDLVIRFFRGRMTLITDDILYLDRGNHLYPQNYILLTTFYKQNMTFGLSESVFNLKIKLDMQKKNSVQVTRNGFRKKLSMYDLLPGDIVHLSMEEEAPADRCFLSGFSVLIDESSLTGVSNFFVVKSESPCILSGTKVQDGSCKMLVIFVGMGIQWGKLMATLSERDDDETQLQVKLNEGAAIIGKISLFLAMMTFAVLVPRIMLL